MKSKNWLTQPIVLIAIISSGHAQAPILTADSINPVIGESLTGSVFSNVVNPGPSGANQTWDFSSYSSGNVFTGTVVPADSTPYSSDFPSANVAAYFDS